MDVLSQCRCCLTREPDKDLKTSYSSVGKVEVYADMIKDCFEINLTLNLSDVEGICEVCIMRLRDAYEFKHQILQCQKDHQQLLADAVNVKEEPPLKVKEEVAEELDDNNDSIYFMELTEDLSELDDMKLDDDEDDKKLVELLRYKELTVKKHRPSDKKRHAKKRIVLEKSEDRKKKAPIKISLRTLTQMNLLNTNTNVRFVNDNMKHKVNITNILKYSNCTPFFNKTLSGIVCIHCKELRQTPKELRSHIAEVHSNNMNFLNQKRMHKNNLSVKIDITDLKCKICEEKVSNISNLKKHLSQTHDVKFYPDVHDYVLEFKLTDTDVLNCALCNSTFETFKMLLQHMNGHYRNYICDVCDMGFINQHRLKSHQRTHETGTFKCSFCEKVFTTRVRKICHEKYTHSSQSRYTTNCPQCDMSFTSYYQRNRHMFKDHQMAAATYKCNICVKSFILKSKLTAHIKKVHLMEQNHTCAECGQGFFKKQSLDEHMIKHNGERVFKCLVCHKAYARKKTLREHMRIHNNDRRFKCGVCSLAFVQKCSLKSHMLSNHGVSLSEFEAGKAEGSCDGTD